jgi:hypothetical protein
LTAGANRRVLNQKDFFSANSQRKSGKSCAPNDVRSMEKYIKSFEQRRTERLHRKITLLPTADLFLRLNAVRASTCSHNLKKII